MLDTKQLLIGAWSGIIGGIAFGAMMGMMGMLPMVAQLVGSQSAFVGILVHAVISALTGAAFALIFGRFATDKGRGIGFGLLYGLIWWFLGPLIIMPLWLGMGLQLSVSGMSAALPSLWGHLVWGFILGLVYTLTVSKSDAQTVETSTNEKTEEMMEGEERSSTMPRQ